MVFKVGKTYYKTIAEQYLVKRFISEEFQLLPVFIDTEQDRYFFFRHKGKYGWLYRYIPLEANDNVIYIPEAWIDIEGKIKAKDFNVLKSMIDSTPKYKKHITGKYVTLKTDLTIEEVLNSDTVIEIDGSNEFEEVWEFYKIKNMVDVYCWQLGSGYVFIPKNDKTKSIRTTQRF